MRTNDDDNYDDDDDDGRKQSGQTVYNPDAVIPIETVQNLLLGKIDPIGLANKILPPEKAAAMAESAEESSVEAVSGRSGRYSAPYNPPPHRAVHHIPAGGRGGGVGLGKKMMRNTTTTKLQHPQRSDVIGSELGTMTASDTPSDNIQQQPRRGIATSKKRKKMVVDFGSLL